MLTTSHFASASAWIFDAAIERRRIVRKVASLLMAFVLAASPTAAAAQKAVPPAIESAAFKEMAAAIPLGSRIKLQTKTGGRLTATLMSVSEEAIIVQRASRVAEPPVTVPFNEIARLQRDDRNGLSLAKAIGVGLASGAGAILTLFAIALSIDD
jgi:hypothetical protein